MKCCNSKLKLLYRLNLEIIEEYFFAYAFPCLYNLKKLGKISSQRYNFILKNFEKGEIPTREELEDIFSAAFRRLKLIAKEKNKNYWDREIIVNYWRKDHNKFIEKKDGIYALTPEKFNEFCKVYEARVLFVDDKIITVKYNDNIRNVLSFLCQDIKIGDKVIVHLNYAIEKIN
jgi:hypothetical protein